MHRSNIFARRANEETDLSELQLGGRKVIVNYLPANLTLPDLRLILECDGKDIGCVVNPDGSLTPPKLGEIRIEFPLTGGRNRSFAFVEFATTDIARKVVDRFRKMDGLKVADKTVRFSFARKNCDDIKHTNLLVKNMPAEWGKRQMKTYFQYFGNVITVSVPDNIVEEHDSCWRSGYVRFDLKRDADLCIAYHRTRSHITVELVNESSRRRQWTEARQAGLEWQDRPQNCRRRCNGRGAFC